MNLRFMFTFFALGCKRIRTLRIGPRRYLAFIFTVLGALFNFLSIFLPWGYALTYLYLPWSPVLNFGSSITIYPETVEFASIVFVARTATIAGWVGIILNEYAEKHAVLSSIVLLVSSFLSFLAVGVFAIMEPNLSWGAYFSLIGGALIVCGVVLNNTLEVAIEVESPDSNCQTWI